MRPGSDPTQQRTVAELLAKHGGVNTAVRRRRRRDDPDDDAADGSAPPEPATVRDLVPPGRRGTPSGWTPSSGVPAGPTARPVPPQPSPAAENGSGATTLLGSVPRGSSRRLPGPPSGPGPVTPEPRRVRPFLPNAMRPGPGGPRPGPAASHGGPWTPPAGPSARREVPDSGPVTGAWNPFVDDDENGAEAVDVSSTTVPASAVTPAGRPGRQPARTGVAPGLLPARNEPPTEEHPDDDDPSLDEHDYDDDTGLDALDDTALGYSGLDDSGLDDSGLDDSGLDDSGPPLARSWAGVVAQWLTGAVVGAVLWVLFRYLWRGLPVVAFAAALLVTAGLVIGVRQLLHDVDRRATAFAVLVGLLLTASPAVLVLLGR